MRERRIKESQMRERHIGEPDDLQSYQGEPDNKGLQERATSRQIAVSILART